MNACLNSCWSAGTALYSDSKNDLEICQREFGEGVSGSRQHILCQLLLLCLQCGNFLLHCVFTHKPIDNAT